MAKKVQLVFVITLADLGALYNRANSPNYSPLFKVFLYSSFI